MQIKLGPTVSFCISVILILLNSIFNEALSQDNSKENNWLKTQITEMEQLKSKSTSQLKYFQAEIQKCEKTIKKCQDIISQAQQQKNRQAETVANDALIKAYDAKKKNKELLDFENFNYNLIEKKLSEFNKLLIELENQKTTVIDDCDKLAIQLERDKRALKNFSKTIEMSNTDREEWTQEGKDAMKEAGMTLVKFFTGEIANHLTTRDGKLKLINKEIERYKKEKTAGFTNNKYLIEQMDKKLKNAESLYKKIPIKNAADYTLTSDNVIEIIKSDVELSQSLMEKGDKDVVGILSDAEIRSKLWELNSTFADLLLDYESEILASTKFFKSFNPLLSRITVLRDLIYNVTDVSLSADRVEQLSLVADQELKAVNSLKIQIEKTMEKLNDCKKEK